MPLKLTTAIYFGSFRVNPQVFYTSPLSFALVNLKPLLPGHVLVSPRRIVPRFADLSSAEVSDLFLTVQRVSRMIERVFHGSSLNIAIQDGADAGQSVPHVHAHIIPRQKGDMDDQGGSDAIYKKMDGPDGDIGKHQAESNKFPAPDVEDGRQPRTEEEMRKEAEWLYTELQKDQNSSS